ncbi:MAG TPA: hypothetical protein VD864_01725 [Nocardioides sp.]|nr:hypothetical protein [Nocardioides sp.]
MRRNTVTVRDPRGDTTVEEPGGGRTDQPSKVTTNVDLAGFRATYDESGLVFEVVYAGPLDDPAELGARADAYEVLINFDHEAKDLDEGKALSWSSRAPRRVESMDVNYYEFRCRPRVQPDFAGGRLTITYPVGRGCLPKNPPARTRVGSVWTSFDDTADYMFADDDPLWVALG